MANLSSEERRKRYSTIARKEDIEQSEARKDINLSTKADERRSRYASKDYLEKYNAYHAPTRYDGSAVNRYLNAYGLNQQRQADRMQEYRNRYAQQQFMNAHRDAIRNGIDNGNNPLGLKNLENPLDNMRRMEKLKEVYGNTHKLSFNDAQKMEKAYGGADRKQLEQLKEHYETAKDRDYSGELEWVNDKLLSTATGEQNKRRQAVLNKKIKDTDNRLARLYDIYAKKNLENQINNDDIFNDPTIKNNPLQSEEYQAKKEALENEKKAYQNELDAYEQNIDYRTSNDFEKYKEKGKKDTNNQVEFYRNNSDENIDAFWNNYDNTLSKTDNRTGITYTGTPIYERSDLDFVRAITEEEADNYAYILGKYGEEKAHDYLQSIAKHTDVNGAITNMQKAAEQGKKNPVLATIESAGLGLVTPFEAAKNITGFGGQYRTYDDYALAGRQEALRSGVNEAIQNTNLPGSENVLPFLYNTANSTADNLLRYAVGGVAGKAAGSAGAAKGAMRLMMAGQVGDSAMKSALDRGLTDSQAVTTAIISAINEELFETISLERLDAMKAASPKQFRDIAKNVGKQILAEGSEEVFTDIGNAIADDLVNGEKSEIAQNIRNYMSQGLSEEEAKKKASVDFALQLVESGLAGGLSGATMGGVETVRQINTLNNQNMYDDIAQSYINAGMSEADAYDAAYNDVTAGLENKYDNEGNVVEQTGLKKSLRNAVKSAAELNENIQNLETQMKAGVEPTTPISDADIRDNKENIRLSKADNEYLNEVGKLLDYDLSTEEGALKFIEAQDKLVEKYPERRQQITKTTSSVATQGQDKATVLNDLRNELTNTMPTNETSLESQIIASQGNTANRQNIEVPQKAEFKATIDGEEKTIKAVNNGKIIVQDNNGREQAVDIREADLTDGASAAVEQAKRYGARGSRLYLDNLKSGNIRNYTLAFNTFYNAGKNGKTFYGNKTLGVDTSLLIEAYAAGVADNSKKSEVGGLVRNEARYKIKESEARVLDTMGKKFGVTIQIDNMLSNDANGLYQDGIIHISANAENPALVVFSHEFTHRLEETSPEAYKEYENFVIDYLKEQGLYDYRAESLKNLYARAGIKLSEKDIRSEIAANATESFLTDADLIESVVNENKSLVPKIIDTLKSMINDLKDALSGYRNPKSTEAQAIRNGIGTFEKALELWINAAENQTEIDNSQQQFSLKEMSNKELEKAYDKVVKEDNEELVSDAKDYLNELFQILDIKVNKDNTMDVLHRVDKLISKYPDKKNEIVDAFDIGKKKEDVIKELKAKYSLVNAIVEQYAYNKGYTEKVYHGTTNFGFTKLDTNMSDDKLSFFATNDSNIASTYSGLSGIRNISNDNILDFLKENKRWENVELLKKNDESARYKYLREKYIKLFDFVKKHKDDLIERDLYNSWTKANNDLTNGILYHELDINKAKELLKPLTEAHYVISDYALKLYFALDVLEKNNLEKNVYLLNDRLYSEDDLKNGNYELLANTDNLLEIDGNGANWNAITYKNKKMSTRQIAKIAKENGYSGVVIKNITDDGGMLDVTDPIQGDIYNFFNPQEQLKSADAVTYDDKGNVIPLSERFNKSNPDIRFSLKEPVEETKDLIAVHNIGEENLINILKLGGFPYPSIAITKKGIKFTKFGKISVVFNKDTIDPKLSKNNKIYSGDAYTPTFPEVGYEVNTDTIKEIKNKLQQILGSAYDDFKELNIDKENIRERLERWNGNILNAFDNDALRFAFALDNNFDVKLPAKEINFSNNFENNLIHTIYFKFFNQNGYLDNSYSEYEKYKKNGTIDKIIDEINRYYKNVYGNDIGDLWSKDDFGYTHYDDIITAIKKIKKNDGKTEIDKAKLKQDLNKIINENKDKYKKWINNLFSNVVLKKGIRNNKDKYLSSGKKRSFDSLYDEFNLTNIIKAMKANPDVGQSSSGNYSFFGSVNKEFNSINEIRNEKGRLKTEDVDEYSKLTDEIAQDLSKIANRINNNYDTYSVMSDIAEAVAKNKSKNGIKSFLSQWYKISEKDINDIINLAEKAKNLPTEYFEAKPKRAVMLDEIAYVVIPNNASQELIDLLEENNIDYITYEDGNKEDRTEKLNSRPDVRFSLKEDSEGNKLSKEQQEFFKDSKVVDENGNLRVVYHGTGADFTIFDISKARDTEDIEAFFFSGDKEEAEGYGDIKEFYLNIINPADYDTAYDEFFKQKKIKNEGAGTRTREKLIKQGYDGIIAYDEDAPDYTEYIAFSPEQIKLVNNKKPTDNPDIRFSLKEDSEGNKLTPQQQEYFKDSKVVDENGNLLVMYHGSREKFTEFNLDAKGVINGRVLGDGFYFTNYKKRADYYGKRGKVFKVYLNIKNPLYFTETTKTPDKIKKILDESNEKKYEEYKKDESWWGNKKNISKDKFIKDNRNNYSYLRDAIYELQFLYGSDENVTSTDDVTRILKDLGYDGIIFDSKKKNEKEIVAFYPNQIKNVDNENPTDNPDIRFSLKEESNITRNDVAALTGKDPYMAEAVKDLEDIMRMKGGEAFFRANQKELYKIYDEIAEEYHIKDYSKKRFADNVKELFDYIQSVDNPDGVDTTMLAMQIADDMLDKGSIKDTSMEELYPTLQQQLRDYKIKIADQDKADLDGGYNAFRKKYFGSLTLSNDGTEVDSVYEDLASSFPELFPEDITHPGDRLTRIADVADMFRKTVDHIEGATKNESAFIIAQDIINKAVLEQTKNDKSIDNKKRLKAQEKVRKQNTNIKKAKKDIHDDYVKLQNKVKALESINKRLSKNLTKAENELGRQKKEFADWAMGKRQVNKEDKYYKRKYDKLMQEFSKKKVAELQKKYSAERRKNIEKIRKMVNELDRSVRRPDKNHYIPKYLVSSMLDVLRTIDLDSGYRKPDGSETLVYMKLKEMQKQYQEMQNDMDYAIASEYNETIDKAIGRLAEITKGRRLNELLDKDIADIVEIMEIITYQMRTARDLLENEKLSDIKEASQKAREQIKEAGRTFNTDAKLKNLFNRYLNNSLSPVRVMRRLEGYAHDGVLSSLGEELQQGERKTKLIRQTANEMLDELYKDTKAIKALEKFRSEKLTYNIGGKNIVITPDMRAAIYLHSLNEQNMKHVVGNKTKEGSYRGGGIIIPNYQKQMKFNNRDSVKVNAAEKYTGQDAVRLSPSDVNRIIKDMTEYDKRIVELYQQVNEYLTKELNDTTMNLYGFKKATVKNYFPLIVDKSILNLDTDALKFDKTLESFGFLKERVNSAKPIYLEGVMDALERQIDQSSLFSGMAIPSRDFKKVWNYAAMDENDKFDNVNKQAQKAMGSYIDKYVGNLQADLAQARERGDASALLSAFGRGKMATGVLTGNLSVVLKQAASYPTAAGGVLGYRDLLAGLTPKGQRGKTLEKTMNKYTPLYQDRNTAAITGVNINDMNILKRRNPKLYYALTGWIESMDKATVRRLWYASENYVKRNFDYKVGSDDYYEEVAKVWEDTIRKTQPIYDTMNRPEYLRQTNELLKFLMMFKTQALQNVGIMVENYGELKARKRDYDKDKSDFNKKELVLAQRQFKKTVSSQIIQSLIFTGITALVDAFIKHRPQEWADEETGLITPESLRSSIIDAWTSNVIGQLAFGDIIRDLAYYPAKTLITGKEQNRFDLSVPPIEAMNTIINGINKGTNAVANNDIEKAKYYFKQVGETAAQYGFGLPVKNIENLYKGLEGNIKDIAAGKNPLEQSTDKQMYNRIYLAYQSGNPELAKELSEGYDEDKIKTKMVSKLKEEDTIKEAADYRYKSELDKYQAIVDAYVSLGFDEDWVTSAISSVMNKEHGTTGSGEYNSNDLQRAIDISAVQGSKVAQQMYDEKYATYKADGLKNDEAKKKALSSVRSAITGKYKSQYESGTTSQKVKIRDRLCSLRVAGERLYTYDSMKKWNK